MADLKIVEIPMKRSAGAYRTVHWQDNRIGMLTVSRNYGRIYKYFYLDDRTGDALYAWVHQPDGLEESSSCWSGAVNVDNSFHLEFPELTFPTARAALADLKKRIRGLCADTEGGGA